MYMHRQNTFPSHNPSQTLWSTYTPQSPSVYPNSTYWIHTAILEMFGFALHADNTHALFILSPPHYPIPFTPLPPHYVPSTHCGPGDVWPCPSCWDVRTDSTHTARTPCQGHPSESSLSPSPSPECPWNTAATHHGILCTRNVWH